MRYQQLIDYPRALPKGPQPIGESSSVGQAGELTKELQLASAMRFAQFFKETPTR